jgi:hypothetical protein
MIKLFHYSLSALLISAGTIAVAIGAPSVTSADTKSFDNVSSYASSIIEGSSPPLVLEEDMIDENTIKASDLIDTGLGNVPEVLTAYIYDYKGTITFKGGDIVFPKTKEAIQRAYSSVGDALTVCKDGKCFNKCDHLAGDIWGYDEASGYYSAKTHWQTAVNTGIAKIKDREPPLGALLFWSSLNSDFGHVATYIGNGLVVTNSGGEYGSNVYIYYADWFESTNRDYWGWAPPVFFGEKPGSAL